MKAIILVAGYATRLYPLTINTPKALLCIDGKPIISYILDEINTIPIDMVYVVTNSKFYEHFSQWASGAGDNIRVLDDGTCNEEQRLGAIGDIKFTIDHCAIDDDVLIIAGDNFFTYRLADYYAHYLANPADYVVVKALDDREQLKQFAVAKLCEDDRILELVEKPEEPQSDIAVYAAYIYRRETLPMFERYLSEGNKPDAPGYFVQWLYKLKPVYAWHMNGDCDCYDIGTPGAYKMVRELYEPTEKEV